MGFLDAYDDPEFGGARKAKRQADNGKRNQLKRVVSRTPEVMVKVTSNAKTAAQLGDHLSYISRKGNISLHTSDGDRLVGLGAVNDVAEYWAEDARRSKKDGRRLKTRLSTNIVLSVPKGNPSRVLAAAQDFAHANFANHDWVMALHTDTEHPHVHLAVRNRGKDERRLHIPKGKPQEWRESLAASLRAHGIEAEATRRAERGVVRTGESQMVRHIRARTGRPAETDKSAMRQADNRLRGHRPPEPWRETIDRRQQQVRSQWHKAIEYERTNGSPQLAQLAREFLSSMPAVQTRNDRMERFIEQHREKTTIRDNVSDRDEPER